MKKYRSALWIVLALLFSNCGTLKHGTTQEVDISSIPPGASVLIDGADYGSTPISVDLARKNSHTVSVSMAGYQNFQIIIDRKWSKWAIGNILLGGPIGLIIDHSMGGMYRLSESQIVAHLESQGLSSVKVDDNTIYVSVTMDPREDWEYIGSLLPFE